ncbi:MAG: ComEC/Rec2 family competence protein, partial [Candidatus Phosphoribacter sp.]
MTPPSRGPAPLDLRLLVPAVAAWALDVALLWAGAAWWVVGSIAGLAAITGVGLVHRARWRDGRWESLGALGGLTALALALVTISLAAHDAVRTAGLLDEWADGRATVSIVGVIESDPRRVLVTAGARGDGDQVVVRATVLTASGRGLVSHVDAPVLVIGDSTWLGVAWQEGMRATGRLGPGQPGDDVVAVFRAIGPPEVIDEAPGVAQAAAYVRARFREATSGLPADARGLVPALVIGDTSATPIDLTEAMTVAGMSHLSAVSGSNVAIVLAAALGLCRLGGIPRRVRPVVAGIVLAGFVVLARPEPSVIRAAVMGAVGLAGLSTSRRRMGMPALSAAVIALLCWDPWLARSYGFALSVLATLGLLVFAAPWGQRIATLLPPGMRGWGPALAVPAAAQLMCAPVVVLLQGTVSLVAVPANLLADPFVAPATVAGVATALIAVLWTAPAGWVAWVAAMPTLAIAWIARVAAVQPWGSVPWPDGPVGALLLAALGALAVLVGPWARWVS